MQFDSLDSAPLPWGSPPPPSPPRSPPSPTRSLDNFLQTVNLLDIFVLVELTVCQEYCIIKSESISASDNTTMWRQCWFLRLCARLSPKYCSWPALSGNLISSSHHLQPDPGHAGRLLDQGEDLPHRLPRQLGERRRRDQKIQLWWKKRASV